MADYHNSIRSKALPRAEIVYRRGEDSGKKADLGNQASFREGVEERSRRPLSRRVDTNTSDMSSQGKRDIRVPVVQGTRDSTAFLRVPAVGGSRLLF
jgi:hypothetical protein